MKTKWISHRGNLTGPNPDRENNPEYINQALQAGYDVEVDVWKRPDGFWLGHDEPIYHIERFFLQNQRIWAHCKDAQTYQSLQHFTNINCFFQDNEELVRTSKGFVWAHSKYTIWDNKTVGVALDSRNLIVPDDTFAICSDYVREPSLSLPFDLLIIDIDGVLTDGTKMCDRDGKVFGKQYCDLDFTAIKRFIASGINVCFLSGDQTVNKMMAGTRKITFFHNQPGIDKVDMLDQIKQKYQAKKIAYVGDDYYDLAIMNMSDLSFCPNTSPNIIKRNAIVIDRPAGHGVLAGLYDMYENQIPYSFPVDSPDVNPK